MPQPALRVGSGGGGCHSGSPPDDVVPLAPLDDADDEDVAPEEDELDGLPELVLPELVCGVGVGGSELEPPPQATNASVGAKSRTARRERFIRNFSA
jgi:hypothetical protein